MKIRSVKARWKRAFTFVEILITTSIFSIIFVLAMQTFIQSFRDFDTRSARLDTLQQSQIFTAYMRRDLRTSVWGKDTPMQFLPNGVVFYRVTGVKVGTDGNIGMPELRLVQYAWDAGTGGILRTAATENGVEERIYLKGKVGQGGFRVTPVAAPAGSAVTGDAPLRMNVQLTFTNGVRAGSYIALFSRFMGLPGRSMRASAWYDNFKIHPSNSGSFRALSDYRTGEIPLNLSDADIFADSGLAMGADPLLAGGL